MISSFSIRLYRTATSGFVGFQGATEVIRRTVELVARERVAHGRMPRRIGAWQAEGLRYGVVTVR